MMIWIGILIGVVVTSFLSTTLIIISDEVESSSISNFLLEIASGPIGWLIILVSIIYKRVKRLFSNFYYHSVLLCPDGKIRHCRTTETDYWKETMNYEWPDPFPEKEEQKKYWSKKYKEEFCPVSRRYVPRPVWKNYEELKITNQTFDDKGE